MEVSKGSIPAMHNARQGDMTDEEVFQCILDLETWFKSNCEEIGNLYAQTSPATEDAIKELEKSLEGARIDPVLKSLLMVHDGNMPLYTSTTLPLSKIMEARSEILGSGKGGKDIVPLAVDGEGDYLVCHDKGVSSWSSSEGLGMIEAPSLASYIEKYRDEMLRGKLEYIEGCGIVDVV